jgi:hypothetical protein
MAADGKFDPLEVETPNFKAPRNYEQSGIPLHPEGIAAADGRSRMLIAWTRALKTAPNGPSLPRMR